MPGVVSAGLGDHFGCWVGGGEFGAGVDAGFVCDGLIGEWTSRPASAGKRVAILRIGSYLDISQGFIPICSCESALVKKFRLVFLICMKN